MLSPPLFPFESQAVLGLVCVLCKCRVGGEQLISGIVGGGTVRAGQPCGLASADGEGRAALICLFLQVQVPGLGKESRAPLACTLSGTLLLCSLLLRAFLLRVRSRASEWGRFYSECIPGLRDYSFWLVLEKRSAKRHPTLPCGGESLKDIPAGKLQRGGWFRLCSGNVQQVKLRF